MIAPIITEKIVDLANNTNYCFEVAPQGDGRSRYVDIILLNHGVAYNVPSDATIVTIEGENAGGYNIYNECTYNKNIITIPLDKGLLSFAGLGKYQISIYGKNATVVTSFKFNLFVTECPYDVIDLQASDSYEALNNLISKVNGVIENGGSSGSTIIGDTNKWIVGNEKPSNSMSGVNVNDYYLNSSNGNIYKYSSTGWTLTNYNIKEKVYIKYSNNSDGTDFDDYSSGKSYIGICTTIDNVAPEDKSLYKWSLIKNGIKDIVQTVISDEDEGINKIQCTLDDGTVLEPWEIKNGSQGVAAGFGTPTYSNENANGVGDAEVIVTAHGLDTEKIFNFEFKNIKGKPGLRGASWTTGTDITGTSTTPTKYSTGIENALVDDMYLNTNSGDMYKCTVSGDDTEAKWIYIGRIKGTGGGGGSDLIPGNDIEIVSDTISVIDERYRRKDSIIGKMSHAEGTDVVAIGDYSHAEGKETIATAFCSHAEGNKTNAYGYISHAEGYSTSAGNYISHAEGDNTISVGWCSHAEGKGTIAIGDYSHVEGYNGNSLSYIGTIKLTFIRNDSNINSGSYVFTYKNENNINGNLIGIDDAYFKFYIYNNELYIPYSNPYDIFDFERFIDKEVQLYNIEHGALSNWSHAEGHNTTAQGSSSHAEGSNTTAQGNYSHTEGQNTTAQGDWSHAEGSNTTAQGSWSHAEGSNTTAQGDWSHAEGNSTTTIYNSSHAEGRSTIAKGSCSHAEGDNTTAEGSSSHAEGDDTIAKGYCSHAEGSNTIASGDSSHAEGDTTIASGNYSHTEGRNTTAEGGFAHAEGYNTIAKGSSSHAEGYYTIANYESQHVSGKYNKPDSKKIFIIGVGEGESSRNNGFSVDYNGYTYDKDGALRFQFKKLSYSSTNIDLYPDIVQYIGETNTQFTYGKWYKKSSNITYIYAWVSSDNKKKYTKTRNPENGSYLCSEYGSNLSTILKEYNSSKDAIIVNEVVETYYPYSNSDKSKTFYTSDRKTIYTYENDVLTEYPCTSKYTYYLTIDNEQFTYNSSLSPVKINGDKEYTYSEENSKTNYSYSWFQINESPYELPQATSEVLGGIKVDGETITVDENGVISATFENVTDTNTTYTLSQDIEDDHKLIFTPSEGESIIINLPNDKVIYDKATSSKDGLMSASDKAKLDSLVNSGDGTAEIIDTNTTYTLSQDPDDAHKLIFKASDEENGTVITIPNNGTTYENATSSMAGLMSAEDKSKLDNIEDKNTTYTLTQDSEDGHKITLTPSEGSPTTITIPDNNTEYEKASTTELGLVKVDGTSITIDENGVISSTSNSEGTSDYSNLENKPSINGIELNGEKSLEDLGIIIPSTEGFVIDSNYVHTDNNFTNADKTKLDGLENSDDYVLPVASSSTLGGVKIDNDTIIIDENGVISAKTTGTSEATSNYSELSNKPSINNVELSGNKSLDDLGIAPADDYVIDKNYVHTDNNYSTDDKDKLSLIDDGANKYILPQASQTNLGGVKIDGTSIVIDENGVISSLGESGTVSNYDLLENRPSINGKLLTGDLTLNDLGITPNGESNINKELEIPQDSDYITRKILKESAVVTNNAEGFKEGEKTPEIFVSTEYTNEFQKYHVYVKKDDEGTSQIAYQWERESGSVCYYKFATTDLDSRPEYRFIKIENDNDIITTDSVVYKDVNFTEIDDLIQIRAYYPNASEYLDAEDSEIIDKDLYNYYRTWPTDGVMESYSPPSELIENSYAGYISFNDLSLPSSKQNVIGKVYKTFEKNYYIYTNTLNVDDESFEGYYINPKKFNTLSYNKSDMSFNDQRAPGLSIENNILSLYNFKDFKNNYYGKISFVLNGQIKIVYPTWKDLGAIGSTVQDNSYIHTDNNFTNEYKTKLDNIEENANNYELPIASTANLGGVKVDNDTITIDENGVIKCNSSSTSATSLVLTDDTTGVKYKIGIDNGKFYMEEVNNG